MDATSLQASCIRRTHFDTRHKRLCLTQTDLLTEKPGSQPSLIVRHWSLKPLNDQLGRRRNAPRRRILSCRATESSEKAAFVLNIALAVAAGENASRIFPLIAEMFSISRSKTLAVVSNPAPSGCGGQAAATRM